MLSKVLNDLNIETNLNLDNSLIDKQYFKNNASEKLFNKLNSLDKEVIYKQFDFDKKIYDNNSLFWIPN